MYSKMTKILLAITITVMLFTGICTTAYAQNNITWESFLNTDSVSEGTSTEIVQYNGYIYAVSSSGSSYIDVFKINNDGTLKECVPDREKGSQLYYEDGQINTRSCRNVFIDGSSLYVMMSNVNGGIFDPGFIRKFNVAESPEIPEFVCDYKPTLDGTSAEYYIMNAGIIGENLQAITVLEEAYKFAKDPSLSQSDISCDAISQGDLKFIPYYMHSFNDNGKYHTFMIDQNSNLYYIDHAQPESDGSDWQSGIARNVRMVYYHEGYLYVMNTSNELNVYEVKFDAESEDRSKLSELLGAGTADAVLPMNTVEPVGEKSDVEPIIWNNYMLIAVKKGVAVVDISSPVKPELVGIIEASSAGGKRTMAVYNDYLYTIDKNSVPASIDAFKLSSVQTLPTASAEYNGNSVTVKVENADDTETFMAIMAVYTKTEDNIDTLVDWDYEEITGNNTKILTVTEEGTSVVTYVWKKDLTPIAKFIK